MSPFYLGEKGFGPVLCFGTKVLHIGGDCSIVGRSGVLFPMASIGAKGSLSKADLRAKSCQSSQEAHLSNQHTMCGASVWQNVVESGGKERDRNIASSAKCRNTVTLSQFHCMRGLKYKKTFPPVLKPEIFRGLFPLFSTLRLPKWD